MSKEIISVQYRADYLIPTYNLGCETIYVGTYALYNHSVNVWAINAEQGQELESMRNALRREQVNYQNAAAKDPTCQKLAHGVKCMQNLIMQIDRPIYHKQPIDTIKMAVAEYFRTTDFQINMAKAQYLEGVQHMGTR